MSTGYDIREYKDKYQIEVDLPGIKATDLKVQLESDGRVLHISASRKRVESEDEHGNVRLFSESRIDKRFTVGDNVEKKKMTGNLSHGVLVAPKKKVENKGTRKIPISGRLKLQSKM
jgi:HSP20 family protein